GLGWMPKREVRGKLDCVLRRLVEGGRVRCEKYAEGLRRGLSGQQRAPTEDGRGKDSCSALSHPILTIGEPIAPRGRPASSRIIVATSSIPVPASVLQRPRR